MRELKPLHASIVASRACDLAFKVSEVDIFFRSERRQILRRPPAASRFAHCQWLCRQSCRYLSLRMLKKLVRALHGIDGVHDLLVRSVHTCLRSSSRVPSKSTYRSCARIKSSVLRFHALFCQLRLTHAGLWRLTAPATTAFVSDASLSGWWISDRVPFDTSLVQDIIRYSRFVAIDSEL